MGKFIAGIIIGIILVGAAGFVYLHYGYINLAADQPGNSLERFVMRGAMDKYSERHAPQQKNPLQADDATLIAGVKLYKNDCAVCHGGPNMPVSDVGKGMYPRAPQFAEDAPDMPDNQNYWIIKHGVQRTGMPAWDKIMTDSEIWQVVAFLSKYDKMNELSPAVQAEWKKAEGQMPPAPATGSAGQQTPAPPKEAQPHRHDHSQHE